ncbi:MAG: DNA utilization protein GntX [Pelotomaculum sp. PtaB.Bin104]|nr:MAG: DNA utilization protein GntX [Pelotomaculum sp. PtaB.Bin104]
MVLSGWLDSLLDLFFPSKLECPFCGSVGAGICATCRALFDQYRQVPRCYRCGRILGQDPQAGGVQLCRECRTHAWPFVLARALGPYEGVLRQTIHRLKYGGSRWLARPLAVLMAGEIKSGDISGGFDLIIPVPLARNKLCERGFNQSGLLAKEIGTLLDLPVDGQALHKRLETPAQTGLNRAAREINLQNAFQVADKATINDKDILIIDDVFTTGSTMSAVATTLSQAGAARVFCFTAATGRCL